MGYHPNFFWYEVTPRQTENILHGYYERVNGEHERRVFEMRLLTLYIENSFAPKEKKQTFEQIYPLRLDKQAQQQQQSKGITMPIKDIFKMLTAVFKLSGQDEREITS